MQISVERTGGEAVVFVTGLIGSGFREATLPRGRELVGATSVRINLRSVSGMEGLGSAGLAAFVAAHERRGATVTIEEVPVALSSALFMTPGRYTGIVTSFYIAYRCRGCAETRDHLLLRAELAHGANPEPPRCSADHPMDADDFLEVLRWNL